MVVQPLQQMSSGRRVLYISPNRIGDAVIASGIIRDIQRQWPGAEVTVAAGPLPAPFYRSALGVTEVIEVRKGRHALHWFKLWQDVLPTRWDAVIDTRGSALAFMVRTRQRRVYSQALEADAPKVEMISRLMHAPTALEPELFIDAKAKADVEAVWQAQGFDGSAPVLALAPLAHQKGKSWPAGRWAELVARAKAEPRFAGWRFMVVGGADDHLAAAPALAAAGDQGLDFVGKGDILASAAAISRSALFVGNDSGLMHVAAAAGTPTLGLFGPTEWWKYGPRGPRTAICRVGHTVGDLGPIETLTVEAVWQLLLELDAAYGPQ